MNADRQERDSCFRNQAQTTKTKIRYPYALDVAGQVVNIYDAPKGQPYQCLACGAPMLVKRGDIRQPHFAHKHSIPCTDPDTALHKVAQALIIQSIDNARNNHEEYRLGYPCPGCGEEVSYNIAPAVTHVEPEESVVEGTRSDIVLYRDGRNAIIMEVVVTHDLEPDTRQRYIESGLPVFLIQPAWDSLDELNLSVIADTTLNLTVSPCHSCIAEAEQKRQQEEKIRKRTSLLLNRMEHRKLSDPSRLPFRPWTHDKYDCPIFHTTRRLVYANAIILAELGFIQTKNKPWLFRLRLTDVGVIFANFGSTEEVPIWEDTAALIHWNLENQPAEMESAIVRRVLDKCRTEGAEVRVSFYNGHFDRQENYKRVDPVQKVNRGVLSKLLTESDRIELERRNSEK